MKNTLMIASISAAVIAVYIVFFSVPVCVSTAAHRNKIPSSIGICPSFVDTSLEEIRRQFGKRVAVGDGAEVIENALVEIGVIFSWDRFSQRYQGIIRHPTSKFHAITVYVYADEQKKYTSIEVNDSFTSL